MKVDIKSAFTTIPPAQDFVLPNLLRGTVGILTSPGATGKSMFALQAACVVAYPILDQYILNLGIRPEVVNGKEKSLEEGSNVVYLSLEDDETEIKRRLYWIAQNFTSNEELRNKALFKVAEKLTVHVTGDDIDNPFYLDSIMNSTDFDRAVELCRNARLVIIDTFSRSHKLDENDNSKMSEVISRYEELAKTINTKPSILLIHHQSKSAALSGNGNIQGAARGASALTDNPRFGAFMQVLTKEELSKKEGLKALNISEQDRVKYVRYGVSKSNYGEPSTDKWFKKVKHGVLKPAPDIEKVFNGQPENPNQGKLPLDTGSNVADISTAKNQTKKVEVVFKGEVNDIESY